jgi:GTP cyclohydrolase II
MTRPRKSTPRQKPSAVDAVIDAVDAFRRGKPVAIAGAGGTVLAYAVETLAPAVFRAAQGRTPPRLILTHARARTLKIRLYTPDVVALAVPRDMDLARLRAIADPTDDLAFPLKGPFDAIRDTLPVGYAAAVKLAKLAGLLPAALVRPAQGAAKPATTLKAADIQGYDDEIVRTLKIVARARVPLDGAEQTEMISFRPEDGGPEHYAIVIGAPPTAKPVLMRMHSECFTGDFLGSLKCDCGSQLRGAITAIAKAGGGVLLYMAQEGRGIGLINKLRAYELQAQGLDTVQANLQLGFPADARDYGIGNQILSDLGLTTIRILTNNPKKLTGIDGFGLTVVEQVPIEVEPNDENRRYLEAKRDKLGHRLHHQDLRNLDYPPEAE